MISELTRRDLRDLLKGNWSGRLTDLEFLGRLYDLDALPSTDTRHKTMTSDVAQHTPPAHEDWVPDWIFDDDRLGFADDQTLLRFVAETVHPVVVDSRLDVNRRVREINDILAPDGYEMVPVRAISGRPVFAARTTTPRRMPTGGFSSSLVSGIAKALAAAFSHTEIDSFFEDQDFPRPDDFGGNKVEKVKAWLRHADRRPEFDHWRGLAKVLATIFEPEAPPDSPLRVPQEAIRNVLGQINIGYVPGGYLTTGALVPAPSTVLILPEASLPPLCQRE